MSTSAESTKTDQTPLSADVIAYVRHYIGGRRGLIILAVVALGAGAVFNWGWLVAAGIAPLLLALAPCALMCAAGLCMSKTGGKSCSSDGKALPTAESSEGADSALSRTMEPPLKEAVPTDGREESPAAAARLHVNGHAPKTNGKALKRKAVKGKAQGQRATRVGNTKPERRLDDA